MNILTLRRGASKGGAAKLCVFFSPLPLQEPPAVTSMIPYAVFSGHFSGWKLKVLVGRTDALKSKIGKYFAKCSVFVF